MPGAYSNPGSLATASLQLLLDKAVWVEASWFYCLMPGLEKKLEVVDLCAALEVSHISCCSTASCSRRCQRLTQYWLFHPGMLTMACRGAWLCLRVTSRHANMQVVLNLLKARWLLRGGAQVCACRRKLPFICHTSYLSAYISLMLPAW